MVAFVHSRHVFILEYHGVYELWVGTTTANHWIGGNAGHLDGGNPVIESFLKVERGIPQRSCYVSTGIRIQIHKTVAQGTHTYLVDKSRVEYFDVICRSRPVPHIVGKGTPGHTGWINIKLCRRSRVRRQCASPGCVGVVN